MAPSTEHTDDTLLHQNIEQLRERGIFLGLSDKEIDECILRVVNGVQSTVSGSIVKNKPPKSGTKKRGFCFRVCQGFGVFVLCIAVFAGVVSYHEPSGMFVGKILQPYAYPIFRAYRLLTLPITQALGIQEFAEDDCLVSNPWFQDGGGSDIDCEACQGIDHYHNEGVDGPLTLNRFYEKYHFKADIFMIQDPENLTLAFEDLRKLYVDHESMVTSMGGNKVYSTDPDVKSLKQLFSITKDRLKSDQNFHGEWVTDKVNSAAVLRQLFKKPYFVPADSEVSTRKLLMIDGAKAKPYAMGTSDYGNHWYHQASGERKLIFMPNSGCKYECKNIHITVKQGHIVFFSGQYWQVHSVPVFGEESSSDLSIGFLANFT